VLLEVACQLGAHGRNLLISYGHDYLPFT
jgi:hypothetical protein